MKRLNLRARARALAIVAHPDDETIWMGGLILNNPSVRWTIFSLCRAGDRDRRPKFERAMRRYGARGLISGLDDENLLGLRRSIPVIKTLLAKKLPASRFDYVFTHGEKGEYGHKRHIGVHRAVSEQLKAGKIKADKALVFNYRPLRPGSHKIVAQKDSAYLNRLDKKTFYEKQRITAEIYGYPRHGIDVGYCTNPEAFKRLNLGV